MEEIMRRFFVLSSRKRNEIELKVFTLRRKILTFEKFSLNFCKFYLFSRSFLHIFQLQLSASVPLFMRHTRIKNNRADLTEVKQQFNCSLAANFTEGHATKYAEISYALARSRELSNYFDQNSPSCRWWFAGKDCRGCSQQLFQCWYPWLWFFFTLIHFMLSNEYLFFMLGSCFMSHNHTHLHPHTHFTRLLNRQIILSRQRRATLLDSTSYFSHRSSLSRGRL